MNTNTFVARVSVAAQLHYARKRLIRCSEDPHLRNYYAAYIDGLRFAARALRKPKNNELGQGAATVRTVKNTLAFAFALMLLLCSGCSHFDRNGVLHVGPRDDLLNVHLIGTDEKGAPHLTAYGLGAWREPVRWGYVDAETGERTDNPNLPYYESSSNLRRLLTLTWHRDRVQSGDTLWVQASKNGKKWRTAVSLLGGDTEFRFVLQTGDYLFRVVAIDPSGQKASSQILALR